VTAVDAAGARPSGHPRWPGVAGALAAGAAVAAGAFGAHALGDVLTAARLATYETAVRYQLVHAVALLVLQVALAAGAAPARALVRAAALMAFGTAVFCGSLYALVASDVGAWGAVAPIGGAAMIAGWAAAAWAFATRRPA
jgi:uncharacterized membrane protein YgdD (TMEM256/DUF423 family)